MKSDETEDADIYEMFERYCIYREANDVIRSEWHILEKYGAENWHRLYKWMEFSGKTGRQFVM